MDRPKRKCNPVVRYSPPPIPRTKKRRKSRGRSSLARRAASQVVFVPPPIKFWRKIKKKTNKTKYVEEKVFGNEDLWRYIKTFIFYDFRTFCVNGVLPRCVGKQRLSGQCPNNGTVKQVSYHSFKVYRQGYKRKSKLPTYTHQCRRCANYDPYGDISFGRRCTIC